MHFVHIIEINDPRNPLLDVLTRDQLWRGLVRRAERPQEFLPQLVDCVIVMRGATTMARELNFGNFTVRDRVRLMPMEQISFVTDAGPTLSESRLVITIEQFGGDHLQLRFTYDTARQRIDNAEMEDQYDRFIQSAYLQTDIDSIKIIRSLVQAGEI
jgi:hypothetical protein